MKTLCNCTCYIIYRFNVSFQWCSRNVDPKNELGVLVLKIVKGAVFYSRHHSFIFYIFILKIMFEFWIRVTHYNVVKDFNIPHIHSMHTLCIRYVLYTLCRNIIWGQNQIRYVYVMYINKITSRFSKLLRITRKCQRITLALIILHLCSKIFSNQRIFVTCTQKWIYYIFLTYIIMYYVSLFFFQYVFSWD